MTLSIKVFGFEVARIELETDDEPREVSLIDRGKKATSRWWVRGMVK